MWRRYQFIILYFIKSFLPSKRAKLNRVPLDSAKSFEIILKLAIKIKIIIIIK